MRCARVPWAALALLSACSAVGNPTRSSLRPAGNSVPPASDPAPATVELPASTLRGAGAPGSTVIARVDGRPIEVAEFLTRAWLRDSERSREILDHLVVERLAILEAQRLGLTMAPELVDERLERAHRALLDQLSESGSGLTPAEHIERNLGLEPAFYDRQLRHETLIQLIAARCVRIWAMEAGRRVVRLLELENRDQLDQVRTALARGEDFDALADRFEPEGPTRLNLVRAENSPLARLAFATEVGRVGGPLEEGRRFLLLHVERQLEPLSGTWAEIGPQVESSLAASAVDDVEFVQWRAAMARRYPVDLQPFFETVGTTR